MKPSIKGSAFQAVPVHVSSRRPTRDVIFFAGVLAGARA